jgi:hypothetical protein
MAIWDDDYAPAAAPAAVPTAVPKRPIWEDDYETPTAAAPAPAPAGGGGVWNWLTSDQTLHDIDKVIDPSGQILDVAKSAGSGLAEGVVGLPGLPGDIEQLGRAGANWASQKLGGGEVSEDPSFGTSEEWVDALAGDTFSYAPKTRLGEAAKNVAGIVPGAVLTGPGGLVRGGVNMAKNALVYGVAPGLGGEVGSEVNKAYGGLVPDWAARLGGAILGGAGGAAASHAGTRVKNAFRGRAGSQSEQLEASSGDFFRKVRESGEKLDPNDTVSVVDKSSRVFQTAAKEGGFTASNAPETFRIIGDRFNPESTLSKHTNLDDLNETRQQLSNAARDGFGSTDGVAAKKMLKALDDELDGIKSVKGAVNDSNKARQLWTAARRTETVEDMVRKASVGGPENLASGLSTQARTLARNKNTMRQFSPTQRRMINDLAKGPGYVTRVLGDLSAGTAGSIVGGIVGSTLGPAGSVAGTIAGSTIGMTAGAGAAEAVRAGVKRVTGATKEAAAQRLQDSIASAALGRREVAPRGGMVERNARRGLAAEQAAAPIMERWGNTYAQNPDTGQWELIQEGAR